MDELKSLLIPRMRSDHLIREPPIHHLARMSPAPSRRGRGAVSSRERRWRGAWQLDRMEHRGPVLL